MEAGTKLHDFAADMVPPFKKALDTREPTCVTIALELMQSILRTDPEVGGGDRGAGCRALGAQLWRGHARCLGVKDHGQHHLVVKTQARQHKAIACIVCCWSSVGSWAISLPGCRVLRAARSYTRCTYLQQLHN